jgi:hypothetical protein
MSPEYQELRACIFGDISETSRRFRQLLVNSIIATDIFDKNRRSRARVAGKGLHDESSSDGSCTFITARRRL